MSHSHPRARARTRTRRPSAAQLRALFALLVLTALTVFLPGQLFGQEGGVSLPVGTQAPDAAVEDLDGNALQLASLYQGKPTVLEFWASWCKDCEALMPQMTEVQNRWGDEVNVIAVAVGVGQSVRRVRRHLERDNPGYPHVWDGDGAAVRAFKAPTTAIIVVLDAEGRVAYTGVGPSQDIVSAVERVTAGR